MNRKISLLLALGVVIKLLLLCTFSSQINDELFRPFIATFLDGHSDPWQYYSATSNSLDAFPYHALMLYLFAPFRYLSDLLGDWAFDIPLLLSDLFITFVLFSWFPQKRLRVVCFYFLNPIILYATYVHAQLDLIPTAFLLGSVLLLTKNRFVFSAVVMGLAVSTKSHTLLALPILLFYSYRLHGFRTATQYMLGVTLTYFAINFPYLSSEGFISMVLTNPKQSLLFDSFYRIGELHLLLPFAAILAVYMHLFNQKKINIDLLYFYFGVLFVATIFFVYPAPGWYVWIVPFLTIYFVLAKDIVKAVILHLAFSLTFLVFFILFYQSQYQDIRFLGEALSFKIGNEKLRNLSFTLLEVSLLAVMYAFYKYGMKSNTIYNKQNSLAIGVGGDSGVGKTTLIKSLEHLLGEKLLQIEGDGEHKWERGHKSCEQFTHLDPKANHIHQQAEAILDLKQGRTIYRREYDHGTGKFTVPKRVLPKPYLVIAGLHPFYLPKLRKTIDLKIYLDTDENLRRHWKILRDTEKRGYSVEKILTQIESRVEDAKKYIYPQKRFSDLIIRLFAINDFSVGDKSADITLGLRVTLDASIHLEDILAKLNCEYRWDYNDDLTTQYIELEKAPDLSIDFQKVADHAIENLSEIISPKANWQSGYDGFIQLVTIKMISERLKEE